MKPKTKKPRREPLLKHWRFSAAEGSRELTLRAPIENPATGKTRFPPAFDELVVGPPGACAIHVEAMDANSLFVGLGPEVKIYVWRDRSGKTRVLLYEGVVDPATHEIHPHGWTAGRRA